MSERACVWSLTINNPTPADEECIALARQKGWKVEGQLEKGLEGTPHYQLLVRTPQLRFAAVKKAFPRGHIEIARNVPALTAYVHKEETKVAELSSTSDKYPSLSKLWDLLYHELSLELDGPPDEFDWNIPDKRKLALFDDACSVLISKGFHIETMAVNPQVRCAFTKFVRSIFIRSYADRQTDRQNALISQEASVPIIENATDETPVRPLPPPPPPPYNGTGN